jgi:hypothetical protein
MNNQMGWLHEKIIAMPVGKSINKC